MNKYTSFLVSVLLLAVASVALNIFVSRQNNAASRVMGNTSGSSTVFFDGYIVDEDNNGIFSQAEFGHYRKMNDKS